MMRMILITALVIMAVAQANAGGKKKKECLVNSGKRLVTFGGTPETVKFPCKYNAIRGTVCGKYRVTVSPGNQLESNRNKLYVIRSMYVGVERISDGKKWEGRTDLKIASKYLAGLQDSPYNTKDGNLGIKEVFRFGDFNNKREVSLLEKTGDFKITFGLYDPYGKWHRTSKFSFECYDDKFEPTPYPTQLCGNETRREVQRFKKTHLWGSDNRLATLFFNIFSDDDLMQTDDNCAAAQKAMSKRCVKNGEDLRYKAAKLCWPLVGQAKHQRCISRNMDSPIVAFRHCVEFVCSGYTDKDSCERLGDEIDMCPKLQEVSDVVKDTCKSDLHSQ